MVSFIASSGHDFQSIDPPTAGLIDVAGGCLVSVGESDVEADEHPATETNKTEAISVLRSTQKTLGAGSPVASTGCEWVLTCFSPAMPMP